MKTKSRLRARDRFLGGCTILIAASTGLFAADPNGNSGPAPSNQPPNAAPLKDPVKVTNGNLINQAKQVPATPPPNAVAPVMPAPVPAGGGKKGGAAPGSASQAPADQMLPDLLKSIGKRAGQPDLPGDLPDLKKNRLTLPDKTGLPLPPLTRNTGKKSRSQTAIPKAVGSEKPPVGEAGEVGNANPGSDSRLGGTDRLGNAMEAWNARELENLAGLLGFGIEGLDLSGFLKPEEGAEFGGLLDFLGNEGGKGPDDPPGFKDPLGSSRTNAPPPPSGISFGGIASHEGGDGDDSAVVEKIDLDTDDEGRQTTTVTRGNRETGSVEREVLQENPGGGFTSTTSRTNRDGSWSVEWVRYDSDGNQVDRGWQDSNGNHDLPQVSRREWHRRGGADRLTENPGDGMTASERSMNLWIIGRMGWNWSPPASDPRDKSVKTNPADGRFGGGVNPPPRIWQHVTPESLVINPDPHAPSSGAVHASDRTAAGLREQVRGAGQGVTPGPSGPRPVNSEALQGSGTEAAVEGSGAGSGGGGNNP